MRIGKVEEVPWEKYRVKKFFFPDRPYGTLPQCGAWALCTLTKKPYHKIERINKTDNWSTAVMLGYLRKHGYTVIPVTLGNLIESNSVRNPKSRLNERHVLLIDQHVYKEESTWSVIYSNMYCHSGELKPLEPMEFFNFPIQAAYLVWHKSWV